jgi:aminoacylase
MNKEELEKIERLREYIRIKTAHPNVNYTKAINWLKTQAERIGLPYTVYEDKDNKLNNPVILIKWENNEIKKKKKSVLLYSHMDVVNAGILKLTLKKKKLILKKKRFKQVEL